MGIMAAEQQCLDENWSVAWRLTALPPPPWAHWGKVDVAAVKRDHPRNRMADPSWVAALVAELKDEDFMVKRRGGKGAGKKPEEDKK